jgi:putative transposase
MDGRGRATDNAFIERLWRSVKQEDIYRRNYKDGTMLWVGLEEYFRFYNTDRHHQSLDYQTPEKIYFDKQQENEPVLLPSECEAD